MIFTAPRVKAPSEAYLRAAQGLEGFPAGLVTLIVEPCAIEQSTFTYSVLVNQRRSCSRREICAVVTLVSTVRCSPPERNEYSRRIHPDSGGSAGREIGEPASPESEAGSTGAYRGCVGAVLNGIRVRRRISRPASESCTCPVRSLRVWLDTAHITEGSIFRAVNRRGQVSKRRLNRDSVGIILKRAAARAGLKTDTLGGHSLRAGHVTQAAINGVSEFVIMKQTGHRSVSTLRRYIRLGEMFSQNAASGLGI